MSSPVDPSQIQGNATLDDQQDIHHHAEQDREATELHHYTSSNAGSRGHASATQAPDTIWSAVKAFWRRQVAVVVPHAACRDHFALERTYLGYLRTSFALAILSVFIAQLFRLQHTAHPDPVFGFYRLGVPLSCICTGAAIVVNLLGTYRFWRQQNAMLRGKILCGGWEMLVIYGLFFITSLTILVLVLALDIRKDWLD
ncbi:MAG: hypothetical protein Q9203_001628 [Teloschistes exilis]